MEIKVVRDILKASEVLASETRKLLQNKGVFMVNLIGSAGSGKTTLLERTIEKMGKTIKIGVIEGDIATSRDAERIGRKGAKVIQINTHGACHLESNLISKALHEFAPEKLDLIVVENVGNLVCPAEFDIGEDAKVGVLSVPEGDDKPMKYPLLFRECACLLLTKVDLIPYTPFSKESFYQDVDRVNSSLSRIEVSSVTMEGIAQWCAWLEKNCAAKRKVARK